MSKTCLPVILSPCLLSFVKCTTAKDQTMFHKYLILILLSATLLQAAPKVYNSLGEVQEAFQKDCKIYQKSSLILKKIQKQCKAYVAKVDAAFKFGYKLDPYIDSDNLSETKLNKYLKLLKNVNNDREHLKVLVYAQIKEAKDDNKAKYYSQLIQAHFIHLNSEDYKFMDKYPEEMKDNQRYIQHVAKVKKHELEVQRARDACKLEEERQKEVAEKERISKRNERHEKILAAAQKDLERQTSKKPYTSPYTDKTEELELIEKAKLNDPDAMLELVFFYAAYGYGEHYKKFYERSAYWALQAASLENSWAAAVLAGYYREGKGVLKDCKKSFGWTKKAAKLGVPFSQLMLGDYYYRGVTVQQDLKKSFYWRKKAFENHLESTVHPYVELFLAHMYYHGEGIQKDKKMGDYWVNKAIEQGPKHLLDWYFSTQKIIPSYLADGYDYNAYRLDKILVKMESSCE